MVVSAPKAAAALRTGLGQRDRVRSRSRTVGVLFRPQEFLFAGRADARAACSALVVALESILQLLTPLVLEAPGGLAGADTGFDVKNMPG